MPDYTNTSIYKIYCLDEKVKDFYIGYTTNITNRMNVHKNVSLRPIHKSYNQKTYRIIRKNGGWSNWVMFPLDVLETDDYVAVRQKETELMKLHKSTLNTINSYRSFEDKKVYDKE